MPRERRHSGRGCGPSPPAGQDVLRLRPARIHRQAGSHYSCKLAARRNILHTGTLHSAWRAFPAGG
eukprot:6873734-Heterocapsa_arctica.AAC.1